MIRHSLSGFAWVLLTAAMSPAQDWARNLFQTTEHNFGAVARGAKAEHAFVITNSLQNDVHIAAVRSSCGCTTPIIRDDKRTLKAYEKGAIVAHLNSDTYLGQRSATLTVTIDQPVYAEVQLQIRGYVTTTVLMEPTLLQLGAVEQGKGSEAEVKLYRADYFGWQITGVQLADPNLHGEIKELARRGSEAWYALKVRMDPRMPSGYIHQHAILTTNDPVMPHIPVQVEGQVRPSVTVSPADTFLGVVQAGNKVSRPLVIRADKPFHIKSLVADKAAFEIPSLPGEAKQVHVVMVTFVAGAEVGKIVKTIRIETDLGDTQATTYAVVNENK